MIPWFVVDSVGAVAWRLGFETSVLAQGGSGWHRGRFGADRLYFTRVIDRNPKPLSRLKRAQLTFTL